MSLFPENSSLTRDYAWDLCYQFFTATENQGRLLRANCDETLLLEASVHLSAYLGFFGMMRGSSFLLKTNPSFFVPIVRDIWRKAGESNYALDSTHPDHVKPLWNTLSRSLRDASKDFRESTMPITQTLISKILLGMFACSPAYDQYFNKGFQSVNWWTDSQQKSKQYTKIQRWNCFLGDPKTTEFLPKVRKLYALEESIPPSRVFDLFFWDLGRAQKKPRPQLSNLDPDSAMEAVLAFRASQKA